MRKEEVKIGGVYQVKVSNHLSPVRLDKVSQYGGWDGTNLHSGRSVRIRSAQKLRLEYEPNPIESTVKWLIKRSKEERIRLAVAKARPHVGRMSEEQLTAFANGKGLTLRELQDGLNQIDVTEDRV